MSSPILSNIINLIQKSLGRQLKDLEIQYVKTNYEKFQRKKYSIDYFTTFIQLLIDDLKNPNTISSALEEPYTIDMHEVLKREIGQEPETMAYNVPLKKNQNLSQVNISRIFSTDNPLQLLRVFNPMALIARAYIILDRQYQLRINDNNKEFIWNLAVLGQGYNHVDTVVTVAPVKDIIGLKMSPFKFPNTQSAITFSNRISVSIKELDTQSYIANAFNKRFHFLFDVKQGTLSTDPYELSDTGQSITEFWFYKPVQEITSLTLSFGNPFYPLTLDPDRGKATITASGIQAVLTFANPHFVAVNGKIVIVEFTTTDPLADTVEIELMNEVVGWDVVSATATTLTIDVDLSGLTGTIISPTLVLFESKRFLIPLEIMFLRTE